MNWLRFRTPLWAFRLLFRRLLTNRFRVAVVRKFQELAVEVLHHLEAGVAAIPLLEALVEVDRALG